VSTDTIPAMLPVSPGDWWTALLAFVLGLVGGIVAGLMPKDAESSTLTSKASTLAVAALEGGVAAIVVLLVRNSAKGVEFIAQSVLVGLIGRPVIDALKTSILNQLKAAQLKEMARKAEGLVAGRASTEFSESLRALTTQPTLGPAARPALERLDQLERFVQEFAEKKGKR
jgi:hypothetical protein